MQCCILTLRERIAPSLLEQLDALGIGEILEAPGNSLRFPGLPLGEPPQLLQDLLLEHHLSFAWLWPGDGFTRPGALLYSADLEESFSLPMTAEPRLPRTRHRRRRMCPGLESQVARWRRFLAGFQAGVRP